MGGSDLDPLKRGEGGMLMDPRHTEGKPQPGIPDSLPSGIGLKKKQCWSTKKTTLHVKAGVISLSDSIFSFFGVGLKHNCKQLRQYRSSLQYLSV